MVKIERRTYPTISKGEANSEMVKIEMRTYPTISKEEAKSVKRRPQVNIETTGLSEN